MSEPARLKSTVYIGGLDPAVTPQLLHDAFIPFGDISNISLPRLDNPTNGHHSSTATSNPKSNNYNNPPAPSSSGPVLHRGFAYIEFESPEDAKEALANMDQSELFGRVIKVAMAKPKKDEKEGLGSKVAIWEQVGGEYLLSLWSGVIVGEGGSGAFLGFTDILL